MELISQNVNNFIQKLPEDIINRIISFTHTPKPSNLLHDIRNYYNSLSLIKVIYFRYWEMMNSTELDSQQLLLFQIKTCANNNRELSTFFDSFRHIWFRNFMLNNNYDFDNFIVKFNLKPVQTQINMFWGILKPEERQYFIAHTLLYNLN